MGEPRAIHPASPVEASAAATVLSALLIGIAALGVITFGLGDVATVAFAIVSVLAVLMGRRRARRRVRAHLEGLGPGRDLNPGPIRGT